VNPSEVILVKGTDTKTLLEKAFNHLNEPELIKGKDVVLKPNLACWDPRLPDEVNSWVVVKPQFIADFIRFLKTLDPKSITVAESAFIEENMEKKFKSMKLKEVIDDSNVEIINLDKHTHEKVEFFDRKIEISKIILDADVVINMPIFKTHGETTISIGMKNLKGTLSANSKKIFHRFGLSKSIAELSKILKKHDKPTLTLIEGLVGLEGLGPLQTGKPKEIGCIILGKNTVSVDAVAAAVMGIDPMTIEHVKLGQENGVGQADLSRINVIGDKINDVKVQFELPPSEEALFAEALRLLEISPDIIDGRHGDVCSTCMLNYLGPIWALRDDAGKSYKQKIYLISGHGELPTEHEGQLLLWGNCQKKNYMKCKETAIFVEGCPPTLMKGYMSLGKALYARKQFIIGLVKRLFKGMNKIGRLSHWPED